MICLSKKLLFSSGALFLSLPTIGYSQDNAVVQSSSVIGNRPTGSTSQLSSKDETPVGEIIVTASKRSEHLQDVPESIKAFSKQSLALNGIVDFDALGRSTPGLSMSARQNNVPDVTVRGVGSYGTVQGVGFYIDDVINFTDQIMRLEDVDRVEILKGPQGSLYGGSSLGGAVRYITKIPSLDDYSGELQGSLGGESYRDVYGAFNVPIVPDKLGLRVSGYYNHDDGFVQGAFTNSPTAETVETSIRAQILAKPTDKFTILVTVKERELSGGAFDYVLANDVKDVPYKSQDAFTPYERLRSWGGVLNMKYDLGSATLNSITSATTLSPYYHIDNSYSNPATTILTTANARPAQVYTQELRLTSQNPGKLDWIAGLYAQRYSNLVSPLATPLVVQSGARVFNPYDNWNTSQVDLAAFGNANLHLGSFTLSGGLRVDNSDYEAKVYSTGAKFINADVRVRDTVPLPKFTLSYKAPYDVNLYASAAEGFEAGKVDPTTNPPTPYNSETDWSYEVGAKGYVLGHGLYYELSAYYIDQNKRQEESVVLNSSGVLLKAVANIGNSTSKGVEGTLNWRPINGLSFDGSAAFLDATWAKDAVYNLISVSGMTPPNSPEWTAHLGATYSRPISNSLKVTLHTDASYTDSFLWQLPNAAVLSAPAGNINPAYWVGFARIAIATLDDRWELSLRGDNLFNQKYYTEYNPAIYSAAAGGLAANGACVKANCSLGAAGPLQRFVITLTAKF